MCTNMRNVWKHRMGPSIIIDARTPSTCIKMNDNKMLKQF